MTGAGLEASKIEVRREGSEVLVSVALLGVQDLEVEICPGQLRLVRGAERCLVPLPQEADVERANRASYSRRSGTLQIRLPLSRQLHAAEPGEEPGEATGEAPGEAPGEEPEDPGEEPGEAPRVCEAEMDSAFEMLRGLLRGDSEASKRRLEALLRSGLSGRALVALQRVLEMNLEVARKEGLRSLPGLLWIQERLRRHLEEPVPCSTVHAEAPGRLVAELARALEREGLAVAEGFLSDREVASVRREMSALQGHFHPSEIWLGKQAASAAQLSMREIRGDRVLWMCGQEPENWENLEPCPGEGTELGRGGLAKASASASPALQSALEKVDRLVQGLSELVPRLRDLCRRSDAMLAVYPGEGTRFQAHVDNTASDGRRLTALLYFNPGWKTEHGGALRVHGEGARPVDVQPLAGRLALFFADTTRHEVLPAFRHRYSCNLWYYDSAEMQEALRQLRERGMIGGEGSFTAAEQAEAQAFLRELLGSEASSLSRETPELAAAAGELTQSARCLVSSVLGGGPEELVELLSSMSEFQRAKLRASLG